MDSNESLLAGAGPESEERRIEPRRASPGGCIIAGTAPVHVLDGLSGK